MCYKQAPVAQDRAVEPHYGSEAALKAADALGKLVSGLAAQLQGSNDGSLLDLQSAINSLTQSVQASMLQYPSVIQEIH